MIAAKNLLARHAGTWDEALLVEGYQIPEQWIAEAKVSSSSHHVSYFH